jgi:hypothetical protein
MLLKGHGYDYDTDSGILMIPAPKGVGILLITNQ